jgi:hypothetical protein
MSQTLENDADHRDESAAATSPPADGGWRSRVERISAGRFTAPFLTYVAAHALTMIVALVIVVHLGKSVSAALGAWDSGFYAQVARQGYERHLLYKANGQPKYMGIAFFPLLPVLMKAVALPTGISYKAAGEIINVIVGPIAGVGIFAVLRPYVGRRTALIVVALWASVPPSYVQSMAYSDALFTALASWALYALLRKQWLTAGGLTILAGLTRSTAVTLIATVCLVALLEVVRRHGGWRPLVAALIAPLGLLGFFGYLWVHTGVYDAWFIAERANGWSSSFDFGRQTFGRISDIVTLSTLHSLYWFAYLLTFGVIIAATASTVLLVRDRRLPWPVIAWTVGGVALTLLSAGSFSSKARFLMPLFFLLVPAATALNRARPSSRYLVLGTMCLIGGWFGTYFMVLSKIAP